MEDKSKLIWRRFGAAVIDYLLWQGLRIGFNKLITTGDIGLFGLNPGKLLAHIVGIIVTVIMLSSLGASIGMLVFRIRVKEISTGSNPRFGTALWRCIVTIYQIVPLSLGYLWVFFDSRMQSFADKLAKTLVVPIGDEEIVKLEETDKDKKIWKTGLTLFIISLVLFVSIHWFMNYDQKLMPEVQVALRDYSPEADPTTNGFYSLIAFAVPEDQNPHEIGFKRVTEGNEGFFKIKDFTDFLKIKVEQERDSLNADLVKLSPEEGENLTELVYKNRGLINKYFTEYDYLESRYAEIAGMDNIETKYLPNMLINSRNLMPILQYNRLYCAKFMLEYMRGDKDKALEMMRISENVTTNLLEKSDTLMSMLTASMIVMYYQDAIAELLNNDENIDKRLYNFVANMKEYSPEAMSIRKAFMGEYNELQSSFIVNSLNDGDVLRDYRISPDEINSVKSAYMKPNTTFNLFYKIMDRKIRLTEISSLDFANEYKNWKPLPISFIGYLNNSMGTILAKSSTSDIYLKYLVRIRDLQVRQNLLKVATLIKGKKLLGEDVQQFLDENKDTIKNPYTDGPLNWDMMTGILSFDGPMQKERAEFRKIQL